MGLAGCLWAAGACAQAGAGPADGQPAHTDAVVRHFSDLASEGRFNGSVLLAEGDTIVLQQGFGLANFELSVPLQPAHVYLIASLTKPVTAALVLTEVEAGTLELDRPFCEIVDFCLGSWSAVTIRQLLSHRSGIQDHFGDLASVPVEDTGRELRRAVAALDPQEALAFRPDQAYDYSNFNYVLLGAVLEEMTGQGWETLAASLGAQIGAPSLAYDRVEQIVPGRVRGYRRTPAGEIRNIDYLDHAAYAAGGLHATAEDFFRFSRAALQARLFSAGLRDLMVTAYPEGYGLGWAAGESLGEPVYHHTGRTGGFAAHIAYYPRSDLTALVFTNVMNDDARALACDAVAVYRGHRTGSSPEPCALD